MIRYQKDKTNVDFTEARDSECQHPTAQVFTGRMPFLPPNQQRQSKAQYNQTYMNNNVENDFF